MLFERGLLEKSKYFCVCEKPKLSHKLERLLLASVPKLPQTITQVKTQIIGDDFNSFEAKMSDKYKEGKSMTYAIVTEVDMNALAMQFFQSKKIPEKNLCPMNNVKGLVQVLAQGDTVWVLDVDRFGSVIVFWEFYQICRQKGVTVKFLANPYLNTGDGKKLKVSQEKFIQYLISVEHKIYADICRAFRNADATEVQKYAGHIAVNTLAEVFSTEGILKRNVT